MMLSAIRTAADISLLCRVVRTYAGDVSPEGTRPERRYDVLGNDPDSLRKALLVRVRQFAAQDKIWSQADPTVVLWFWWGSDLEAEVRAFTAIALIRTDGLK